MYIHNILLHAYVTYTCTLLAGQVDCVNSAGLRDYTYIYIYNTGDGRCSLVGEFTALWFDWRRETKTCT